MDSRFANLKRLLLAAGAVAAFSFVQAQTLLTPGQPIVFSAPDDGDAAPSAPSLATQPPAAPGFADMIRAPEFNLNTLPSSNVRLPVPPPVLAAPARDPRANWWMMTPAEIMGVATPEQILQIPERDATGQRKNLTVVERYYARQEQAQTNGNGGFLSGTPSLRGDFLDNENRRLNANNFNPARGGDFGNPEQSAEDPLQNPAPGADMAASRNGGADWSKNFISPPPPVQSPAQAADMAEFRKLLESGTPSKSSRPSSGGGFVSSPQTPPASAFGQLANPASFRSFNNGIGGLPGGVGQSSVPAVTAVPDWKPKPPPWMSQGPQPGVAPKRKF